jgi:large subunit ribosomal protein L29
MKVDELRVLEADELGVRLKTARRELYELRFKHAVGQLENSSQIGKVRHDIARIMTVLHEREFGIVATPQEATASPLAGDVTQSAGGGEEPADAGEEAPAKPKRTRKKTEETK